MAKVKAAPLTARLITLNDVDGKAYDVVPGGPDSVEVEIPDRVAKSNFAQALVNEGQIIITDVGEDETEEDDERAALRAQAEELGIKVDKRWKADRLQSEIDSKLNEQ